MTHMNDTAPHGGDPDTGWRPGWPMLLITAGEDGAILHGWRVPSADSIDSVIGRASDQIDDDGHINWPQIDPGAWWLISAEHAPLNQDRMVILAASLTTAGVALDLSAAVRSPAGDMLAGDALTSAVAGWLRAHEIDPDTGTSLIDGLPGLGVMLPGLAAAKAGAPPPLRPVMDALARETQAAETGAKGAALDLNAKVHGPGGQWLPDSQLAMAVADWLGSMGVTGDDLPQGNRS